MQASTFATVMLKILFYLFLIYLLYKLVFDFIIPISRTTSQVKKKIREMQKQQQYQQQRFDKQEKNVRPQSSDKQSDTDNKDYIDFEEVK